MESNILVMKFGGTSVGTPAAMAQVVKIVQENRGTWPQIVVVTSALSGVTDQLLSSVRSAIQCEMETVERTAAELRQRHFAMIASLVALPGPRQDAEQQVEQLVTDFSQLCHAISVLGEATPRALDAVSSLGERLCAPVLAAALISAGIPAAAVEATRLVVTDDQFQSAHPDMAATTRLTRKVLLPLLEAGQTPVATGFIGATPAGITTTLGRGGSDYSAAILGAALPAREVWIWTDVDGVMTADPRLVPEARTIPILSYREIGELAYFGAKVVHPKTIRPVIEAEIGLRVCNTFNPSHPGTRLVSDASPLHNGVIKAVTAIRGLRLITIEGRGMLGVVGVAARTFGAVAATGTSVPLITQASSEQSICFAVPSEAADLVVDALQQTFKSEIAGRDIDRVWAADEVVIVSVVGSGMSHTPGVAGRIFSALGAEHVNVIAIAQGSSEVSISLVVDGKDVRKAVNTLHSLIIK